MKPEFSVEEAVKDRYSVRTYSEQPITQDVKDALTSYIANLSNPFSVKVNLSFLESQSAANSEKLGTYGVIKGATTYIGSTVKNVPYGVEALGYEFEKLILYATSLGLGTCWLGGTFNRSEFAKALEVSEDTFFPAISPIGYPSDKKRMTDSLVRFLAKSNQRKSWNEIFFHDNFTTPLSEKAAAAYAMPLELVRLAPSASNKQPWRVVKENGNFHFYEAKTPGYSDRFSFDIQRVDLGIAACHFEMSAQESNLPGEFQILPTPAIVAPENMYYLFTWVSK